MLRAADAARITTVDGAHARDAKLIKKIGLRVVMQNCTSEEMAH